MAVDWAVGGWAFRLVRFGTLDVRMAANRRRLPETDAETRAQGHPLGRSLLALETAAPHRAPHRARATPPAYPPNTYLPKDPGTWGGCLGR